ncbi:MAG: cell division protein FtsQ/DivIB [Clostridia bacterium]|nr:cell division protein FtsQ/DivIB [Clostridia bacterium]
MANRRSDRRTALLLLAGVCLAALLALFLLREQIFAVRVILVEGEGISEEEIVRLSGLRYGTPLYAVDESSVREKVEASGIYALDSVTVIPPRTAVLQAHMRSRDAWVFNGGTYLVLDSDGVAIETTREDAPDSAVYVYGLGATGYRLGQTVSAPQARLAAMKSVIEALKTMNAMALAADIHVEDAENITLNTMSGIVVQLGDDGDMEEKIRWMIPAVEDLNARGQQWGTLDVSTGKMADYRE